VTVVSARSNRLAFSIIHAQAGHHVERNQTVELTHDDLEAVVGEQQQLGHLGTDLPEISIQARRAEDHQLVVLADLSERGLIWP